MYHYIVRSKVRGSFEQVNRGNLAAIVSQFVPGSEHWFSGSHAMAGRRDNLEQIQEWYDRLAVIMPDLKFEITNLVSRGWPWNTVAIAEWVDHFTDRAGNAYSNQGVHVIRLKWGKIVELHIYCDTQMLSEILQTLGAEGNEAAVAPPIGPVGPPIGMASATAR